MYIILVVYSSFYKLTLLTHLNVTKKSCTFFFVSLEITAMGGCLFFSFHTIFVLFCCICRLYTLGSNESLKKEEEQKDSI